MVQWKWYTPHRGCPVVVMFSNFPLTRRFRSTVILSAVLLAILVFATGCGLASRSGPGSNQGAIAAEAAALQPGTVPVKALAPIGEVWETLYQDFVDRAELDPLRLSQGAIEATLRATGDPRLQDSPMFPKSDLGLPKELPREMHGFWDTWSGLFQDYSSPDQPLDPIALSQAAIRGLLEAVDDPHTGYIDPTRYDLEAPDFDGNYQGIGSEIYKRGGRFVLSPMPGSPAKAAGIRAGDILVSVDGEHVDGWTVFDAVSRIRGPDGTTVTLEVLHFTDDEPVILEVKRGVIALESITGNLTNDGIAYVRLSAFYSTTTDALVAHLEEARANGAWGIVLDLRDNPGGLLSTSIEVASQFLVGGLAVYQVDGSGGRKDFDVKDDGVAVDLPVVVLVNQFSASGSEVVAGALQDRGRAKLVGVRTFGKGSVNRLKGLSDGGGLYYSFARWYTPSGRLIEGDGLEPDIVVTGTAPGQGDPQLDRALQELRKLAAGEKG